MIDLWLLALLSLLMECLASRQISMDQVAVTIFRHDMANHNENCMDKKGEGGRRLRWICGRWHYRNATTVNGMSLVETNIDGSSGGHN